MPVFQYTALDAHGRTVTGAIDADARPAALRQLQERGLAPVDVASEAGSRARAS